MTFYIYCVTQTQEKRSHEVTAQDQAQALTIVVDHLEDTSQPNPGETIEVKLLRAAAKDDYLGYNSMTSTVMERPAQSEAQAPKTERVDW